MTFCSSHADLMHWFASSVMSVAISFLSIIGRIIIYFCFLPCSNCRFKHLTEHIILKIILRQVSGSNVYQDLFFIVMFALLFYKVRSGNGSATYNLLYCYLSG